MGSGAGWESWAALSTTLSDSVLALFSSQRLRQSFPEGNPMEGAGSVAQEGRGRAGVVPPSPEPLPGEIHLRVHPWRRLGHFVYLLVLQSQGMERPGMALLWVGWKIGASRLDFALCMTREAGEQFPELPWLSLCSPMECDVPWGSSHAGGDIIPFLG